jgi:hypothetical protein
MKPLHRMETDEVDVRDDPPQRRARAMATSKAPKIKVRKPSKARRRIKR